MDIPIICKKINGLLITGGRDLNPAEYKQTYHGARNSKEQNLRYYFYSCLLREMNPKIPILAICWGY